MVIVNRKYHFPIMFVFFFMLGQPQPTSTPIRSGCKFISVTTHRPAVPWNPKMLIRRPFARKNLVLNAERDHRQCLQVKTPSW